MTVSPPVKPDSVLPLKRKRRQAAALEILGHATQYLINEHVHEGSLLKYEIAHLEPIALLKALNRQIYLECPDPKGRVFGSDGVHSY